MKVGVKYCGGCNPRYERKKLVDRIRQKIGNDFELVLVNEDNVYDFVLIICGCNSCCGNFSHIKTVQGILCLKSEQDYYKAIDTLKKLP